MHACSMCAYKDYKLYTLTQKQAWSDYNYDNDKDSPRRRCSNLPLNGGILLINISPAFQQQSATFDVAMAS